MSSPPSDLSRNDVTDKIDLLIDGMVNIKDTTGEFCYDLPNGGGKLDTKSWNNWEWTQGVGLYGLWTYYSVTGNEYVLKIIEDWFAARFAEGSAQKNINTMSVFLTLANVYEKTGNQTYLPWLDRWAEWAYRDLTRTKFGGMQHAHYLSANEQQLWADTLMMTVMPLTKIGKLLNRPHYIEEAKRQFFMHIKYLVDTRSGLFYHGWTFAEGGHNFAKALWARGNSWITMVIPEFIELLDLPPGDAIRTFLSDTLSAQVEALAATQDEESGLWRTLLDQPKEEGSYLESSATAGFAFGILKATRKRYIDRKYEGVAMKAIHGILQNVDSKGELLNTSFGTALGADFQHYKDIPITSMPYGQAMAIMALVEVLWTFI